MDVSLLAVIAFSLFLGFCLIRMKVFAVLVAIAILMVGSFLYDLSHDAPLTHSLLASIVEAVFLPAGYLAGQMVRSSRN